MAEVAPDLRGRDVVHIQCHIGFDTIALARRGARVTGVDFSRASLAKAAELAERCGVEIEWVQANATALPDSLRGGFDVAYATIGAICWIEDIGAWMRSAAATLRPGGRLVLVEIHPLYAMVEAAGEPLRLDFPYAFDGRAASTSPVPTPTRTRLCRSLRRSSTRTRWARSSTPRSLRGCGSTRSMSTWRLTSIPAGTC